jgi:phosphatidylserine decarboxylase
MNKTTHPTGKTPEPLAARLSAQDRLSFWLTNRIPRTLLTRAMGRLSKIRQPWFAKPALAIWQRCTDLRLFEAERSDFESIHDCFVRRLKPGLRPYDPSPELMGSPCDAIVGAHGIVERGELLQAKGMVYRLEDLMQSNTDAASCEGFSYLTLRLTASMYHHFHAPHDVRAKRLRYIHGDVWNVNPPTLKQIPALFAKNERAVVQLELLPTQQTMWLIPVAAVLVASMRFTFSDLHLHLGYRGPTQTDLDADLAKGDEMGWFEHGSTIICIVPPGWAYVGPKTGETIRAGQTLWHQTA